MIPYNECIVFLLAKGAQKAQKSLKQRLKPYGLTPVQGLVMGALYEENGLTASDISKRLVLDNATVSGVLDRLLESDWIYKRQDEKDGRVQRIYLSENIEKSLAPKLFEARREANEEVMQNLSLEERLLFKRLIRDML